MNIDDPMGEKLNDDVTTAVQELAPLLVGLDERGCNPIATAAALFITAESGLRILKVPEELIESIHSAAQKEALNIVDSHNSKKQAHKNN